MKGDSVWWEATVSGTEDGQKHHYSMTFLDFTKKKKKHQQQQQHCIFVSHNKNYFEIKQ